MRNHDRKPRVLSENAETAHVVVGRVITDGLTPPPAPRLAVQGPVAPLKASPGITNDRVSPYFLILALQVFTISSW